MVSAQVFVDQLEQDITTRLSSLDLLKDESGPAAGKAEVIRRLRIALKNELEASELAAVWIATTPEVDIKLALARQAGDEARHYHLIQKHLEEMGVDLAGFNPIAEGYGPMFNLLQGFD